MDQPRLDPNAVPSLFLPAPSTPNSTSKNKRKSREEKLQEVESSHVGKAIKISIDTYIEEIAKDKIKYDDILYHFHHMNNEGWTIKKNNNSTSFYLIVDEPSPYIQCSLILSTDCHMKVFLCGMQIYKIDDEIIPLKVSKFLQISLILKKLSELCQPKPIINNDYFTVVLYVIINYKL